jgi:hypothetical protein
MLKDIDHGMHGGKNPIGQGGRLVHQWTTNFKLHPAEQWQGTRVHR